ncbi:MAG: hypothetical protein CTY18_05835 [Methylomonas sp.]|nr:MAG: hypothetical protein CTY24_13615 [Methylobacter sp.]PPD35996.1 MAG: hypothetical protein CTY18_05835 [Methylomonas sp.]
MEYFKLLLSWPIQMLNKLIARFGTKNVAWMLFIGSLILFGDAHISVILHVLHICWEVLEMQLENVLEAQFQLTPRQAEIVTAWLSFLTMAGFFAAFLFKVYCQILLMPKFFTELTAQIRQRLAENPGKTSFWMGAFSLGTASMTLLLLS